MNKTKTLYDTAEPQETAVLVAIITQKQSQQKANEYLDELAFLAETSGIKTLQVFTQKLEHPDIRTFVGKGKLSDIVAYVKDKSADMVIFDDDLTPAQVRNLENELKCKILDRSLLILNIFSIRAKSVQAKTQVELAQYQYILPRLTRMWTHLTKQKGGVGMRGPGEKELETDRRIVNDRISFLKDKLEIIEKQSITRRKQRSGVVRVALVGYTNVGKSTLMKLLSKKEAFAENKLFATVDSLAKKVVWNNIPFILTDTVGFIRKLPTMLIESFKSTLDEVREADILIHVIDASHPSYDEQIEIVNKTLADIGVTDKPTIYVYNKMDIVRESERKEQERDIMNIDELEKLPSIEKTKNSDSVFISAEKREGIESLKEIVLEKVLKAHRNIYPNFLIDETFWGHKIKEDNNDIENTEEIN